MQAATPAAAAPAATPTPIIIGRQFEPRPPATAYGSYRYETRDTSDDDLSDLAPMFVSISLFTCTAVIIISLFWFRHRERLKLYETVRELSTREGPLPAELLAALTPKRRPLPVAGRDIRTAIVLLAFGAGIACVGAFISLQVDFIIWPIFGGASLFICLGLGFAAMSRLGSGEPKT